MTPETKTCGCENPETETEIVEKGIRPDTYPAYRVVYCLDCNGAVEIESLGTPERADL